ncbi:zinc-binding dehydrogenase [Streptomyces sp. NPDC020667]|uniref:zinc-binding dehydrogenase n=1 Tax=Streptomyces sp. NPDC020667 TaxID=3154895 RepID=UPI0033E0BD17
MLGLRLARPAPHLQLTPSSVPDESPGRRRAGIEDGAGGEHFSGVVLRPLLERGEQGHDLFAERRRPTLREGGTLIAVHPAEETRLRAERLGVRAVVVCTEPDHPGLEALAAPATAGRLRVEIAWTFPLASARQAHRVLETGRTTGKIVLTVGTRTADAA